jgi:asparagine synthase (glutamine-hydrolysing)
MCGIFSLLNYTTNKIEYAKMSEDFFKGQGRGPENSTLNYDVELNIVTGFHRLAINGLNDASNQPIIVIEGGDKYSLICNGEIYNYKQLYKSMNIVPTTDSDCEVIIHLYIRYGIEQLLRMLDGVFAFVLFCPNNIFVARDPYGVRPLYYTANKADTTDTENGIIGFTSELKTLCRIANQCNQKVLQFTPGTFLKIDKAVDFERVSWLIKSREKYHIPAFASSSNGTGNGNTDISTYLEGINYHLRAAVTKRYMSTERPIACLLSGGLDSSLIAALVCDIHKKQRVSVSESDSESDSESVSVISDTSVKKPIETYSIGLPDSEDIKFARIVANHIGSNHTEIIVSEQDMLDIIPEVIRSIESYDTTTVRASIGNYLLGKYIKSHSLAKVIFNGDGSDELAGGYLYMNSCPDSVEYDKETMRLLNDIHLFDVLRSDKSISSHGLEPRTPFLDRGFVNYYLSIPIEIRNHNLSQHIEKYLIRMAFINTDLPLLPPEILFRKKEAFSDGVSNKGKSLFQIIQEYTDKQISDPLLNLKQKEKAFYKAIFEKEYPNHLDIVPYYWMPKYILSDDPSARTLANYK